MNSTERALLAQRWRLLQTERLPCFNDTLGTLTPKLEKVIHILELTRIEAFVRSCRYGAGRPLLERGWIANAFVAKSVLNITNTRALIDRLHHDRSLRRICGFPLTQQLPSESTFSRAFGEFAEQGLAERVHETLVKTYLGQELIGHLSRDSTAIEARERPVAPGAAKEKEEVAANADSAPAETVPFEAERYNIRSTVERTNARLKDEFGGRNVWVQGAKKVYSHLMFGILVLSADQLMRVLL